ncbi:unnamed protein product [Rotaria magnacalcarata]|uniref:Uncharacterized protein n=1 Tax=Rotaria magnacalcarata TaxID=392030 RepID=A0A816TQV1_9BILA|nr:unnamed protein product [Rotaria magnacalcarata]CAF3865863.1 unnamed protein product [Rotaria magnacalcarata]
MASSNRRVMHGQRPTHREPEYFMITLTNFPTLLEHTTQYQQPSDERYIQQRSDAIVIPNRPIRIGIDDSEEHERFLYTTLRFEIEESIRAYLQRTHRSFPITMVFDLSNINQRR